MLARISLTVAALLPYWPLLSFSVIVVTDGRFSSDPFNSELPARVLVQQLMRSGQLPLWTNQICSGYPLTGSPVDPLGLALFGVLPLAPALDLIYIILLLVAAHGTYSLARRFGADASGAVLAGLGFAVSGYIVSQFQHLSIMATIVWMPVGLLLVDRVIAADDRRRRGLLTVALGLVYANQVLAGFPQSAYISGLLYGSFAVFRALGDRRRLGGIRGCLPPLAGMATAMILGALSGAVVILPLMELTSLSDRVAPLDYRWATFTNFWPRNVLTFLVPYINGDASDLSYIGPPPFWENYGYVGAATALVAIYGAVRERRRPLVQFVIVMTILAFGFILGSRTPIYYLAYLLIPGMSGFRAPTRFMVVVDLGLVLLAAVGLTRLRVDLERRFGAATRVPRLVPIAICVVTAVDLLIHQPRQNAFVPGRDWLAPPRTVDVVRADASAPRTYTPRHRDIHRRAHDGEAQGWKTVEPYFRLRGLLQPNTGGGYWNVPSADCYVGMAPRWYVTVWGYHYFETSIISESAAQNFETQTLDVKPGFTNLLGVFGVTHVLSPYPARDAALTLVAREADAYVYRVAGAARVRVVRAARRVPSDAHAVARLRDPTFDPDREILLQDAPASIHPIVDGTAASRADGSPGQATIAQEDGRSLLVEVTAQEDAFLLLADMYYPGWHATIDGAPTPIYRANVSLRAIALPKGRHTVRFTYRPSSFFRGLLITAIALAALLAWLGAALWRASRGRRGGVMVL
jgi:hypothetical protein